MAPTPVLLPGESQGRGSLVGCRLWGHPESDTADAAQQQQQQQPLMNTPSSRATSSAPAVLDRVARVCPRWETRHRSPALRSPQLQPTRRTNTRQTVAE